MKTGLIICSTPYQLMIGLLLRRQFFMEDDFVDLILTDTFKGVNDIALKVEKIGLFRKVYCVDVQNIITPKSKKDKIEKIIFSVKFKSHIDKLFKAKFCYYDEIYFNCEELFTYNIISYNRMLNPKSKLFRYEEGYSSYSERISSSAKSRLIVQIRNSILGYNNCLRIDGFIVFEPDLLIYDYNYPIIKIDRSIVKRDDFKADVAYIFDTKNVLDSYKKDFIIFEESFVRDGFDIDDLELYRIIFKVIGEENVSVKLHPRSKENRFSDFACDVHLPEGVPWEAILLSGQFKNVNLMALASGSIINSRLLLGDSTNAYLLFKCLSKRPPALNNEFERFLDKFNKVYNNGLYIPNNIEELIVQLQNNMHKN